MRTRSAGALLSLALSLACQHAAPDDAAPRSPAHRSPFGFTAEIPGAWTSLSPEEMRATPLRLGQAPGSDELSNIDPKLLNDFAESMRRGELEIFFRNADVPRSFIDNVSVRNTPGGFPPDGGDLLASCSTIARTLTSAYGRPVALSVCEMRFVDARRSLYVEATGPMEGIHSMQYMIERPSGALLVVTATAASASITTVRKELDAMIQSLRLE